MAENFLIFGLKQLSKMNAQRRALSQPTITDPPVLNKGQVMYVPEGQMEGEPSSCYNCPSYNYGRSCNRIGPHVRIRKFVYPPQPTSDAKQIEYWPCCSMWDRGQPNMGKESFISKNDPTNLGLGWINAPRVGQEYGGANCSGKDGGDDCDHYTTKGDDKRIEQTAFCRVLQCEVEGGAVCAAWQDDDWMDWQRAQNILRDLDGR